MKDVEEFRLQPWVILVVGGTSRQQDHSLAQDWATVDQHGTLAPSRTRFSSISPSAVTTTNRHGETHLPPTYTLA